MAKAKKVAVPVAPLPPFTVELSLSKEEAEVILAITEKIGGHPRLSHRRLTDAVRSALIDLGLSINTLDFDRGYMGSIYFKDDGLTK